ncbi:NuA4 histone acetyltransferase subunit [Ascosphaera aggregata]|nr:NuA4 histone acetyltransferase subunit [Ascosphaera aggregata]
MATFSAPQPVDHGQDDVTALILDPGYTSTRAGFGGDDAPRSIIPTVYGKYTVNNETKHVFGDELYVKPRPRLSVHNPIGRDGIVEDWDMAQKVWEYSFTSKLTGTSAPKNMLNNVTTADQMDVDTGESEEKPLSDNPLFMTECGWNPVKAREKLIEIAMENWGTPAFFLSKTGPLAAFAAARASALVVEVGASNVSVTPVHDGNVLKRGIQHSQFGGEYVTAQIRAALKLNAPRPITLTPHYLIATKEAVDLGKPPKVEYRNLPAERLPDISYRRFIEDRTILQFKESVVQTWPGPTGLLTMGPNNVPTEELARSTPARPFEFPDGYNQLFSAERYRVIEPLFDFRAALPDPDEEYPLPTAPQTIPELIRTSLDAVDADLAPILLQNIVLSGATTLTPGFNERLNAELMTMFPAARVRLAAASNPNERKYAAWIGGSIVASLGTFHQMWISKKEYEEHGPAIVEKRCK